MLNNPNWNQNSENFIKKVVNSNSFTKFELKIELGPPRLSRREATEADSIRTREEASVLKVREFVYICCARPPKLRQSARRKRQNFTNFNNSKLIFNFSPPANPRHIRLGRGKVPLQGGFRRGALQELVDQPHGHR